jgi:hypothetical protein
MTTWDGEEQSKKAGLKGDRPGLLARIARWRYYSVTFGVLLPVACFALEFVLLPALGWLPGLVFFHRYCVFSYGVVALELITMATWLRFHDRIGRLSAEFAGVLLAGSLFAGVLGLVLLPFAVLGVLALGIGLLGLVPLFTAHVYFRQGRNAFRRAESFVGRQALFESLLWGAVLVYILPGLIQARISLTTTSALSDVISGDDAKSRSAVLRLKPYTWVADFDPLREAHDREVNAARRDRLAKDYFDLTGIDISYGPERLIEYGDPVRLFRR